MAARRNPSVVGFEFDPKPIVEDPQIAVAVADNGIWHHSLHFLRDHSDIGPIASIVAKAVEAEAIGEMPKKNDVVLKRNVGSTTATAAAATAAATTAATTAAAHARTAASAAHACAAATAEAPTTACRLRPRNVTALDISQRVTTATRRALPRTWTRAGRPLSRARPLTAARALTGLPAATRSSVAGTAPAGTISAAVAKIALTRLEDLVAFTTAEIRSVLASVSQIIVTEFFADF